MVRLPQCWLGLMRYRPMDGDKANQVRYSGLTANYNAAGYRITGAGNGVNPQDYVTMAQLYCYCV